MAHMVAVLRDGRGTSSDENGDGGTMAFTRRRRDFGFNSSNPTGAAAAWRGGRDGWGRKVRWVSRRVGDEGGGWERSSEVSYMWSHFPNNTSGPSTQSCITI